MPTENGVRLLLSRRKSAEQNFHTFESIYCLAVGSDVLANDTTCYLFVFADSMWLIPETTQGIRDVCESLDFSSASKNPIEVIYATTDYLPYRWRAIWWILPGIEPKLQILKKDELGDFQKTIQIADKQDYSNLFFL